MRENEILLQKLLTQEEEFNLQNQTLLQELASVSCLRNFNLHMIFKDNLDLKLFNYLSSRLLSKNLKIKIYETKIFPVVLYGCSI